jgi:hypothetical protein
LGAIFGGAICPGFGSIFTCKNTRLAIVYWAIPFAIIGSVLGLEEPLDVTRLVRRIAYGTAIGVIIGIISDLIIVVYRLQQLRIDVPALRLTSPTR